uniref:Uncharacterized protein n=1 Tax=Faecalibaculum rodentium TaxID=1702221 RepID=A0A140DSQ1_9FIRM|nr:hypothetical protein AALO17_05440 [Faecalibaculum rodentium]
MYFPLLRVSGTRGCIPDLVQNEGGTEKNRQPVSLWSRLPSWVIA